MKNLTIGTRLAAGFGLFLVLTTLMTMFGIVHMQQVGEATRDMMHEPLAKERMVGDWYRLIHTSVRRTSAISKSSDPSLAAFFADDLANSTKEINALQKDVEALLKTDEEKAAFEKIGATRKRYIKSRDTIVALKKDGKLEEADAVLMKDFLPDAKAYQEALNALLTLQRKAIDAEATRIDDQFQSNRRFLILCGIAVIGLGSFCSWWLARGIVVPLHHAVDIACNVANNDLRSEIVVTSGDETGRLLRELYDAVRMGSRASRASRSRTRESAD
jgi:methyl-accepting chemotaxis protein